MLILTLLPHECLMIGPDIVVTIVAVKGRSVRVGVSAPDDVAIVRDELLLPDDPRVARDGRGGPRP